MCDLHVYFPTGEKSQGELLCALPLERKLQFSDRPAQKIVLEAGLGSPEREHIQFGDCRVRLSPNFPTHCLFQLTLLVWL